MGSNAGCRVAAHGPLKICRPDTKWRISFRQNMAPDTAQSRNVERSAVHVIGPLMIQNRLLVEYITQEVGIPAAAWEQIESYLEQARTDRGASESRLVMLDVHGLRIEQIKTALRRCNGDTAADYTALFNLPAGRDLEKRLVPYGIRGIFYERDSLPHFAKGVTAILNNELWMSRSVMTDIILEKENPQQRKIKHTSGLTAREIEILELITIGTTNEMIAETLRISKNTVKTHIYNIFKKIDVPNRLQAALWAVKNR